jgi:hypothetical protein
VSTSCAAARCFRRTGPWSLRSFGRLRTLCCPKAAAARLREAVSAQAKQVTKLGVKRTIHQVSPQQPPEREACRAVISRTTCCGFCLGGSSETTGETRRLIGVKF